MLQPVGSPAREHELMVLEALARKVLWLASWTIHNANHLRSTPSGLKVGGHQASCASLATLMSALYFDVLRPEDRVAVKPHASPVFHAIQYMLGNQSREQLAAFRALGGAQSYPSRTKDVDDVDFSTGSVGLGVAMTSFASLAQDYLDAKSLLPPGVRRGRMIALVGDAELDEGNIYEALLEGWKHDVRDVWWVVDYNRQSLDAVVQDRLFGCINELFESMGWRVQTLKYGRRLREAFEHPGGDALRQWIDDCPNSLYSALTFKGGEAWRAHLLEDIGSVNGVRALLDEHDDPSLHTLMTDLGGHCMSTVLDAFHGVDDDRPTCFLAYTIKGHGLPFAGHKDNHAGLMNPEQMESLREAHGVPEGSEWAPFAGLDVDEKQLREFLSEVPFAAGRNRRHHASRVSLSQPVEAPKADSLSTQECFGRILANLARDSGSLADRIVTTSPDVTVSTNLGGWVNRRGIFDRRQVADFFTTEKVSSFQKWAPTPEGQHIELGIAENNLFLMLAALGLTHSLFGRRLIPIGTLYDPFIQRGLDALNYACYQDARFMLVATPSGMSLSPEGGAHQSISTPLIGMGQDGLAAFEPAYGDELAAIMAFAFDYLQRDAAEVPPHDLTADARGGSVYLRLSTRSLEQPAREMDDALRDGVIDGGYWVVPPAGDAPLAVVYQGVVAPEAREAHAAIVEDIPGAGLLAVTSADRLAKGWHGAERARRLGLRNARAHVETLLSALPRGASLVTVMDGHPESLSWLGSVRGHRVRPLGVERFGQSGDVQDLYRYHQIDTQAIIDACAAACLDRDAKPSVRGMHDRAVASREPSMATLTPLAASAARQLDRDPGSMGASGERVTVTALAPARGASADDARAPAAPRFAGERVGRLLESMARQSGVAADTLRAGAAQPSPAHARPPAAAGPSVPAPGAAPDLDPARGFPESQRLALSGMRRVIASRLSASKREAPHYYMSAECEADALLAMRRDLNALLPDGERLSVNDLVLTLVARCLARHPALNAAWAGDGIARFEGVNLAVAVAVEGGLVTPVLRGADRMDLRELSGAMRRLADAARRRALPGDAFDGGTFTVSNLGMYPVSQFAAIVNPPQAAILAVAAAERRVVALDDERSAVRRVMTVTLSVDHRVADGVAGAEFLADLKALVEDPRRAVL